MLGKKRSSTTVWIACSLVCVLVGVLFGVVRTNNRMTDHQDSEWETVGQKDKVWQTSNLSMNTVPADFNRYHHFVGTPRGQMLVTRDLLYAPGTSQYIPFGIGPYVDKSVIEIQFNNDQYHTLARFRFVEKSGTKFVIGQYSSWQTTDFGSRHNIENSKDTTDQLTFYNNKIFDRKNWVKDFMGRRDQVWDFLHSNAVIGMSRNQVLNLLGPESPPHQYLKDVGYYQLQPRSDNISAPKEYLELKYDNDHVVAFKSEVLVQIETMK